MQYRIHQMNCEVFLLQKYQCLTAAFFFAWCLVSNFQNGSLDLSVFSGTHISERKSYTNLNLIATYTFRKFKHKLEIVIRLSGKFV